jgi:predicted alpha/beta superfamily hydrolase
MRQFFIVIFLLISINIFSQDKTYSTDTIQFKSLILHENRSIIIYKPKNISSTDSIKFIYLLDGENSYNRFKKLNIQFRDSIPNLIGIGIVNTDRRRDLLYINHADKFLDFITKELIPAIEKDYITSKRILFGHSFAGSFTVYSLLNKPDYFNCFIASSPTPIMDLIKSDDYLRIDNLSKDRIVFKFSYGSKDMRQVRKWAQRLNDNLTGIKFNHLEWSLKIFEGKTHDNSDIVALLNGLKDLNK